MFFFLASSQLFPAFIPSVDEGDRTHARGIGSRAGRARGDRRKCTQTEAAGGARAIEVMQMMIMTARHGAWRGLGRWERRDNDRGLIDTRRVDMD